MNSKQKAILNNAKKICELYQIFKDEPSRIMLSRLFLNSFVIADKKLSDILNKFEDISISLQLFDLPIVAELVNQVYVRKKVIDIAIDSNNAYEEIMTFLHQSYQYCLKIARLKQLGFQE